MSDKRQMSKVTNGDDLVVTTTVLAKMFGVTSKRIQQLSDEGVLTRVGRGSYNLSNAVLSYIIHLKGKVGASSDAKSIENEKNIEDMMLKKARREKAELELKIMKAEAHKATDIEQLYTGMITNAKSKLDSIPAKIAPKFLNCSSLDFIHDTLQEEIIKVEAELAEYNVADFATGEVLKLNDDT